MPLDGSAFLASAAEGGLPPNAAAPTSASSLSKASSPTQPPLRRVADLLSGSSSQRGLGCAALALVALAGRQAGSHPKAKGARRSRIARRFWHVQFDVPLPSPEEAQAAAQQLGVALNQLPGLPAPPSLPSATAAAATATEVVGQVSSSLPSGIGALVDLWDLQDTLASLVGALPQAPPELQALLSPVVDAFKSSVQELPKELRNPEYVQTVLQPAGYGAILVALLGLRRGRLEWTEELPRYYDYNLIQDYWQRRPIKLLWRFLTAGVQVGYYILCLQIDEWQGQLEARRAERAVQARELITNLGVTFIKVAQIWASRPDVLPEEYIKEYLKLLEEVRPFGKDLAFETLERSTKDGKSALDLFPDKSVFEEPVASASVGQVYKATLNGRTVAVKVQRPDAREQSTLDLYVIRMAGVLGSFLPFERYARQSESLVQLIDLTAPTFITELDYEQEAANQTRFAKTVQDCDLISDNVAVPEVFFASREVLVQEWLDGVKLTQEGAAQQQAGKVVKLLLNSYMVQFLETGFLHGDPHPGNFILMNDGRLGILDYGLMTEIDEEKRYAFIEFLMHLQAKDYKETLNDLIRLEFFPERLAKDPEALDVIVPALSNTLNTLFAEGGDLRKKSEQFKQQREDMAANGKLEELRERLQVVSKRYQGAFKLPPYFTLILRAFSTLEGLGLKADENFAVAKECFPYIARRLVTDDSFRIREALRSFLYKGRSRIAVSRIDELTSGFGSFTNLMKGDKEEAETAGRPLAPGEVIDVPSHAQAEDGAVATDRAAAPVAIDAATRDVAVVLFSPNGNFLQDILIDEAVAAVDAVNRAVVVSLLGLLGPLALPVSLPLSLLLGENVQQSRNIILTREDKEALLLLRRIVSLVQGGASNGMRMASEANDSRSANISIRDAARDFRRLQQLGDGILPAVAPGAQAFARRFLQQLARRLLLRVADDVERRSRGSSMALR
mmetsp:Transcript_57413/g.136460  ORF Transcript_57413/g.136460 Transcript_57413/m.136460 type:complete len:961 (+) Transcript_57413:59-2941(+)